MRQGKFCAFKYQTNIFGKATKHFADSTSIPFVRPKRGLAKSKAYIFAVPLNSNQGKIVKFERLQVSIDSNAFGVPRGFNGIGEVVVFPMPCDYAKLLQKKQASKTVMANFDENGNDVLLLAMPAKGS